MAKLTNLTNCKLNFANFVKLVMQKILEIVETVRWKVSQESQLSHVVLKIYNDSDYQSG